MLKCLKKNENEIVYKYSGLKRIADTKIKYGIFKIVIFKPFIFGL